MNIVVWILAGGIAGWLTGKLIGEKDYGTLLSRGYVRGLDVLLGIVGGSLVGYLYVWKVIGGAGFFGTYGICVLGSSALVGACRLISARYFPVPSYRGMSRSAFTEWHDTLAMKELASWKPRSPGTSTTPAQNRPALRLPRQRRASGK